MKPMLAATIEDTVLLDFPLIASPKLDGIRALVKDGILVSRKLKPIPNAHVQFLYGRPEFEGLDGELIMGDPRDPAAFRNTSSAVMSKDGTPDVYFWVFDNYLAEGNLSQRFHWTKTLVENDPWWGLRLVDHSTLRTHEELLQLEEEWLNEGYEGMMLRDPQGAYKLGRSTLRERGLMKLKRFEDAEAIIIGFEEQMQNTNEATRDKLGKTKRSNHSIGMKGKDTLGALRVKGINGRYKGVEFSVGSGFNDQDRRLIWLSQSRHLGFTIKFKYFPIGGKDAPRFPTFLGFRED